jgi:hypothetical protein|nr:MAG TPA: Pulmonary surfactant-associated protein [Caudoviricetes sp.]
MSDSIVKWYGHGERPKYPWEQNGVGSSGGGGNGAAGKDGKAATVRVGSVSSGQIASVTNSGTETDAVLNFTLPKGERGERGENGTKGDKGENGKSAYELAKEGGFTGSQEEWLKSLKGKDGRDGQSGGGGGIGGWFPKIVKLTRAEVAEMNDLAPSNGVHPIGNNALYKVKYGKTYDRPPIPFITPNATGNMIFYNRGIDVDGFYFSLSYGTYFDGLSYFLVEDNTTL